MTDEELIARLRWKAGAYAKEAADRIEALVKERDQWVEHTKNAVWADSEELKLANARAERLEAAVRGLMAHEPDYPDTLWQEARAALKGDDHV